MKIFAEYARVVGMKKYKIGKIDTSALNVPPEKHEYETAKYLANLGFNVIFVKPSAIKGQHTPDFEICGKRWETKSPKVYSKSSFEDNLKKAIKQSEHIIFDLRRLNKNDEIIYKKELKKWSKSRKIKSLVAISRDGRVLTIKGIFDIIQL